MNFKATVAVHAPTFNCPNCNHEIKLTESLAAPLIEENRKRFQEQLASKDAEVAKKTEALRKEQEELATAREQTRRPGQHTAAGRAGSNNSHRGQEGARSRRGRIAGEGAGS